MGVTKGDEGVPESEWTAENLMKAAEEANRKAKEEAEVLNAMLFGQGGAYVY